MDPKDILSINPLLTDRTRLAIMAALAAEGSVLDFNTLRENLELSKGNLSTHSYKLEEAGLIKIEKKFIGKKPVTTYRCTDKGRKEIKTYLEAIEKLLSQTM